MAVNSKVLLIDSLLHGLGTMQIAADGKIYIGSTAQLKKASYIRDYIG